MKMVEMFKEKIMKKILISLLLGFNIMCFGQTNKTAQNNLGLKVSVTGASLCMVRCFNEIYCYETIYPSSWI